MRLSRRLSVSLVGVVSMGCGAERELPLPSVTEATPEARPQATFFAELDALARPDAAMSRRLRPRAAGFTLRSDAGRRSAESRGARTLAPKLDVRLPGGADQAWTLEREGGTTVTLIPERSAASALDVHEGRALYRDVAASTDAVVTADANSLELFYRLRDEAAPRTFSFRIALSRALTPRAEEDGGLSWIDERGAMQLTIGAPIAIDARGKRRPGRLTLEGDRLEIALDTEGLTFPVLLDPYIGTARWVRATVDPSPRAGAGLAVRGKNLVLYGGATINATRTDTWEYDGTSWERKLPATSPSPRQNFALASIGAKAVLFGGYGTSLGRLDDTWLWDGATWSKLATAHKPPARSGAGMAQLGTKIVLFGGIGDAGPLGDTWTFDGADWTAAAPTTHPPATYSTPAMIEDHGALYAVTSSSTWAWDGFDWYDYGSHPGPAGAVPIVGHDGFTIEAYDLSTRKAWYWSGAAWQDSFMSSLPPNRREVAYATYGSKLITFGGYTPDGYAATSDAWTYDGFFDFVPLPARTAPSARRFASGATLDDKLVVFGGWANATLPEDTWEWDGRWHSYEPVVHPPGRMGGSFGNAGNVALLVGSSFTSSAGPLNDAWTWNHSTWTQLPASSLLADRGGLRIAHVGATTVLVDDLGAAMKTPLLFDGTTFTSSPSTTMPWVGGMFAAYGGKGLFVEFLSPAQFTWTPAGGFAADATANVTDLPNDLWTAHVVGVHAIEAGPFLVAQLDLQNGGLYASNETWIWDGKKWSALAATGLPYRDSYAFGRNGRSLVLFGGVDDDFADTRDTYTFEVALANGSPCTSDAVCESGHCADGVCCARACDGVCEACDVPGIAGTCAPVPGAPKHGSCPAAGADACSARLCDGKKGDACQAFVGADVACRTAACADGQDVAAAKCDGSGACPTAVTRKCAPFACGADACRESCRVDDECEHGFRCEPATGKCLAGAICADDRTLRGADGTLQSCEPYRCAASACLPSCSSSDDCVGGYACDTGTRTCVAAATGGGGGDGGGCAMGPSSARSGLAFALAALLAGAARRRRARR